MTIKNRYDTMIELFSFQGNRVRVIIDDPDRPLWVARDVASALCYKNQNDAVRKHCKGVAKHYPLGCEQEVTTISETFPRANMERSVTHSLETARRS